MQLGPGIQTAIQLHPQIIYQQRKNRWKQCSFAIFEREKKKLHAEGLINCPSNTSYFTGVNITPRGHCFSPNHLIVAMIVHVTARSLDSAKSLGLCHLHVLHFALQKHNGIHMTHVRCPHGIIENTLEGQEYIHDHLSK